MDEKITQDAYDTSAQLLTDRHIKGKKTKESEPIKTLRWWKSDFYVWEEGRYYRISDDEMKAEIAEYLHQSQIPITSNTISSIMICLVSLTSVGRDITLNSWLDDVNGARVFPVSNGNISFNDIDPDTGKPRLLPHTPWYFTLSKVDYDYDPKAMCPLWESFLHDVMNGNMKYVSLLKQWVGYLFRPDLHLQKFLLCTGEGANGKGVFFDVIKSLVGKHNCSQLGVSSFNPESNRFALYSTLGKIVNMSSESSHIIEHEAENVLKSFVAGDTMSFERKYKEPLSATPTAKVMISTNALPRFNDRTHATWRRILLVPFPQVIPEERQITDLAAQLKRELPGILNWALEGMAELDKTDRFTEPPENKSLLEEYRRDSDPARAFLQENYIYMPDGDGQSCRHVYEAYVQYCKDNGCKPMGNRHFGKSVKTTFPRSERKRHGSKQNRFWIYTGLVAHVIDDLIGHQAPGTGGEKPLL